MIRTKNFQYFIFALMLLTTTASCKKAVELTPVGPSTEVPPIFTDEDVAKTLNYGYVSLADGAYYGGAFQIFNELLADHIDGTTLGDNFLGIYSRNTNIFNADNSSFYGQMNKVVYQANLVLDHLHLANAANKSRYEGEAKFLRSLAYFDIVRMYAQPYVQSTAATQPGIPLRLNSTRQNVSRSTVAESYAQIIKDLKEAETLLPLTNGVSANRWAAKALLAKVYFQMNDFANAYLYANDVITNSGLTLDASNSTRFSAAGPEETIFGLINETNNPQGRFGRLRDNFRSVGGAIPTLRLTNTVYSTVTSNPDDERINWYTTVSGFPVLKKYDASAFAMPVIYLTEIKLIRAESAAELNQNLNLAISDLNEIIARAYGPTTSLILPSTASAVLIKDVARRERLLEFVGEGYRLQELKRRGALGENVTVRGSTYNCSGLIFPFPNNEIIQSPAMTQNPIGGCN